jgi:hypothetical protein
LLEEDSYRSARELAEAEGVTRSFVNRLLWLSLLAPEILEAILDGGQPKGLQLEELIGTEQLGGAEESDLSFTSMKELDEVLCVHLRAFNEHRVTDVGHDGEIAMRHPGRHLFHVLLRDERVKGAPQHQMLMFN